MNKLKFVISIIFIFFTVWCGAQGLDTILNMVISKPFFYNVIKDGQGRILTGSSEGVLEWNDTEFKAIEESAGYVTLDEKGKPVISAEGIKNHRDRSHVYLLPYPDEARDEYHASNDEKLYIVSGGRLYIFDFMPYLQTYQNHSVRSISKNLVATYSGLYYRGKHMGSQAPDYCDGYIREIGDKYFVCYGGVVIVTPDKNNGLGAYVSGFFDPEMLKELVNDILYLPADNHYYLSGQRSIQRWSADMKNMETVYMTRHEDVGLNLLGVKFENPVFSDSRHVVRYNVKTRLADTLFSIPEPIVSGYMTTRSEILLGRNGLYFHGSDGRLKKLATLEKAHSLLAISGSELVIGTDLGLFLFNMVSGSLQPLIRGVEFNRRGLFLDGDIVRAGSINGVYNIRKQDFNKLIEANKKGYQGFELPWWVIYGLLAFAVAMLFLIWLLMRTSSKLRKVTEDYEDLNADLLNREKIEQYIRENLSLASLKSIAEHFNTNNSKVYQLLEPDKPGSIIQQLRMEKIYEMNQAGASVKEMAEETGLSESYVRKIKNSNG